MRFPFSIPVLHWAEGLQSDGRLRTHSLHAALEDDAGQGVVTGKDRGRRGCASLVLDMHLEVGSDTWAQIVRGWPSGGHRFPLRKDAQNTSYV